MRKKQNERVVMLLPPTVFPIPAVAGGAVEQLITHLLDVNETENRTKFVVVSKYDEYAARIKYQNSSVYYLNPNGFVMGYEIQFRFLWAIYRVGLKLFRNRITERILPHKYNRMDLYSFQCALLAKKHHVNFIVNEVHDFGYDAPMDVFNTLVGRDKFFNHIHSVREECIPSRRVMNNSISISKYVRDHWVVDQSIPGRHEILNNCVDVGKFRNNISNEERTRRRNELGIREDDFLVIFIGRLIPEKGVKELLDGFEMLSTHNHIKLLLIGSVAFSLEHTTGFSLEMMKKAQRNPNVIPLGYIPNAQLHTYYALADAQIVPSICQEGAGLVAIEGMAAGLPLVITKSGGMPEYVEEAAIQIPIDDCLPTNISQVIKNLSENPELHAAMSTKSSMQAQKFSREAYYAGFLEIVERSFN